MGLFSLWRRERPKRARLLDRPILRELPLSDPGRPLIDPQPPPLPETRETTTTTPALPLPAPTPSDVRQLLLGAAASRDEEKLAGLCREHAEVIRANLSAWLDVPPELRASPEAARWYAEVVKAVVGFCGERLGMPEWSRPTGAADEMEVPVASEAPVVGAG